MERRRKTLWGYSALGVGLTASAATAIIYAMGMVQRSDAHTRYLAAREQQEIDAHWADIEAAQDKIAVGHVLLGSSLAALGVSAYLLLSRPSLQTHCTSACAPARAIPRLAIGPTLGGGVLQLSTHF
ncbi:MAG: hypothetical protein JRH20_16870 [Deltaproteobacteria bacterium]|nr:hypothetical protein [Deltaproteobacteria bacterium]